LVRFIQNEDGTRKVGRVTRAGTRGGGVARPLSARSPRRRQCATGCRASYRGRAQHLGAGSAFVCRSNGRWAYASMALGLQYRISDEVSARKKAPSVKDRDAGFIKVYSLVPRQRCVRTASGSDRIRADLRDDPIATAPGSDTGCAVRPNGPGSGGRSQYHPRKQLKPGFTTLLLTTSETVA